MFFFFIFTLRNLWKTAIVQLNKSSAYTQHVREAWWCWGRWPGCFVVVWSLSSQKACLTCLRFSQHSRNIHQKRFGNDVGRAAQAWRQPGQSFRWRSWGTVEWSSQSVLEIRANLSLCQHKTPWPADPNQSVWQKVMWCYRKLANSKLVRDVQNESQRGRIRQLVVRTCLWLEDVQQIFGAALKKDRVPSFQRVPASL